MVTRADKESIPSIRLANTMQTRANTTYRSRETRTRNSGSILPGGTAVVLHAATFVDY